MPTYRFDPDLVTTEMAEITAWCQANGLDPHTIPTDAAVRIEDGQLTVDVWVLTDGRLRINPETDRPHRSTTTVPLLAPPTLQALKPVKLGPPCPRCEQPTTGWRGEVIESYGTSGGFVQASVMSQRYEPCGCTRYVDVRPKGDDAA